MRLTVLAVLLSVIALVSCSDGTETASGPGAAGTEVELSQVRGVIPSAAGAPGTPLGDGIELVDGTVLIGDPIETRHELGQGDDQTVTTVWQAASLIDGGDPLAIIDDYLAQAESRGMTDHTRNGCTLDRSVTICAAQAATPSGDEPRSLTISVMRGRRGDLLSDHVIVQHATGEAPWLVWPDGLPPGDAEVPAAPGPEDWPPLATVGEPLETADELERALIVEDGSLLAGPPHLALEDTTGGIEAVLEVTGDPDTVLRSYLDQIGRENVDTWVPGERTRIGDVTQTRAIASVAGGDAYSFTLVERPDRPTWLHIHGGHD